LDVQTQVSIEQVEPRVQSTNCH